MGALLKKVGFVPHSQGQMDYLFSTARYNVPCCGRRWGKSQAAGHRMTYKSFVPDSYNWIVGPTYKLGEKEFRVVWDDYRKMGLLPECKKGYSVHQGTMYIITPWNAHIEVVSADKPDSLVGEGLSHAIMSEAAKHDRSIWEQFVGPALSDLRGTCDFPSTPQGYNWYHGLWLLGQQPNLPSTLNKSQKPNEPARTPRTNPYKSWSFPTWENKARFPGGFEDDEIQDAKANVSPHWFDQEYGASFTTMTGVIYEEWDDKKHIIPSYAFDPLKSNFLALDYGFANPFVALDIQVLADDTVVVWREYYEQYKATMEHGAYIARERPNPAGYHVDGMWGDPRGADEAATLAFSLGHVASRDVPWKHGVEEIKRMLKDTPPRILVSAACPNLIRQMSQLRVKEQGRQAKFDLNEHTPAGTVNIQHKVDDHAADALRYFIGPYFVLGAGAHLEDVYGQAYQGSESEQFMTMHNPISLGNENLISLRSQR